MPIACRIWSAPTPMVPAPNADKTVKPPISLDAPTARLVWRWTCPTTHNWVPVIPKVTRRPPNKPKWSKPTWTLEAVHRQPPIQRHRRVLMPRRRPPAPPRPVRAQRAVVAARAAPEMPLGFWFFSDSLRFAIRAVPCGSNRRNCRRLTTPRPHNARRFEIPPFDTRQWPDDFVKIRTV